MKLKRICVTNEKLKEQDFFAQVEHTRNKLLVGLLSIKLWIVFCVAYLFVGIGNELDMS
jgi:hypothetical protein